MTVQRGRSAPNKHLVGNILPISSLKARFCEIHFAGIPAGQGFPGHREKTFDLDLTFSSARPAHLEPTENFIFPAMVGVRNFLKAAINSVAQRRNMLARRAMSSRANRRLRIREAAAQSKDPCPHGRALTADPTSSQSDQTCPNLLRRTARLLSHPRRSSVCGHRAHAETRPSRRASRQHRLSRDKRPFGTTIYPSFVSFDFNSKAPAFCT